MELLLAILNTLSLIGQTTAPTLDPVITSLNLGMAGLGIIAFVKGWIVPGKTHEEAKARERAVLEDNLRIRQIVEIQLIPEMIRTRESQERMIELAKEYAERIEHGSGLWSQDRMIDLARQYANKMDDEHDGHAHPTISP